MGKRTRLPYDAGAMVLRGVLAAALVGAVGLAAFSAFLADRFTRPVRNPITQAPEAYGVAYEPVQFPSAQDGLLMRGWFFDSAGSRVVIVLHGRNGTRDDPSIGLMDLVKGLVARGYDVLAFDFRAHGESGGTRYSLGQYEVRDLAGALTYLKGRGYDEVSIVGYSMGAAVALLAAPEYPQIKAIVADSSFADLAQLIDTIYERESGLPTIFKPGLLAAVRLVYGIDINRPKPRLAMQALSDRPVFIIQSDSDDFTPVSHGYDLIEAGRHNPNLAVWITSGPLHVASFKNNPEEYLRRVTSFLGTYM